MTLKNIKEIQLFQELLDYIIKDRKYLLGISLHIYKDFDKTKWLGRINLVYHNKYQHKILEPQHTYFERYGIYTKTGGYGWYNEKSNYSSLYKHFEIADVYPLSYQCEIYTETFPLIDLTSQLLSCIDLNDNSNSNRIKHFEYFYTIAE